MHGTTATGAGRTATDIAIGTTGATAIVTGTTAEIAIAEVGTGTVDSAATIAPSR
jgi:hypothetical protein